MSITGIDTTYFRADLFLPNKGTSSVIESLDSFIERYEKDYIYKLLGPTLGDAFIAGLQATPPIASQWVALQNKLVDSTTKTSPIINYVYTFVLLDRMSITTGTGESKSKNENSIPASSIGRQVDAWNQMVDMNELIYEFVEADPVNYPGLKSKGWNDPFFMYKNSFGL